MPELDIRQRALGPFSGAAAAMRSRFAGGAAGAVIELRISLGGTSIGREVTVETGAVEERDGVLQVPVVLRPARDPGLFPVLDGQLSLRSRGGSEFELALTGRYRPPLGPFGRAGDVVVGRRVANRTMTGFVEGLAADLAGAAVDWGERRYWHPGAVVDPGLNPNLQRPSREA